MPNVDPYIYDVSISGFTRSSIYIYIYIYIYDISSLRVNDREHRNSSTTELYIGINRLEEGHEPHSRRDLLTDCHSIVHRRKQPLVQVTELFAVTNVRQTATHTQLSHRHLNLVPLRMRSENTKFCDL